MPPVLAALLPDIGLILLGGLIAARTGPAMWREIDRLNFNLLLPALLFQSASRGAVTLADLGAIGGSIWALLGIGWALGWLRRPGPGATPQARVDFAGQWQTCWRNSTPLAFVAVAAFPQPVQALMGVAVGVWVPSANFLAIAMLSRGKGLSIGATALKVLANPFFIASIAGLLTNLAGWQPPVLLDSALNRLAGAAIPMALLSMGAVMNWRAAARPGWTESSMLVVKLIGLPCAALLLGAALDLPSAQRAVLVLAAALPTAPTAHVLAASFGADPRPTATLVSQSTIIAVVTLPIWMWLALQL